MAAIFRPHLAGQSWASGPATRAMQISMSWRHHAQDSCWRPSCGSGRSVPAAPTIGCLLAKDPSFGDLMSFCGSKTFPWLFRAKLTRSSNDSPHNSTQGGIGFQSLKARSLDRHTSFVMWFLSPSCWVSEVKGDGITRFWLVEVARRPSFALWFRIANGLLRAYLVQYSGLEAFVSQIGSFSL